MSNLFPLACLSLAGAIAVAAPAQADEYDVRAEELQPGRGKIYTTHAPGLHVPGRYQAGPCTEAAYVTASRGAQYEPGVDAHGNPVVPAELDDHSAIHWGGLTFQYLFDRAPTAQEARYGLIPQDYVAVDPGDGTVYYNDVPLNGRSTVPPAPVPCN